MSENLIHVIRLKDFQFNEEILMFDPVTVNEDDLKYTLVTETTQEYLVSASTKRVIRKCCAIFGTSLEETTRLSKEITGASNKLPIVIGPTSSPFVLIPTASPDRLYTSWIALKAIKHIDPQPTFNCKIKLINGHEFTANISTSSINSQMTRAMIIDSYYSTLNLQPPKSLKHKHFTSVDRRSIKRQQ